LPPASAGFFLGSLFNPEDGSDVLFSNIGLSLNYIALQPALQQHLQSIISHVAMSSNG
jgi:hypothetical protein